MKPGDLVVHIGAKPNGYRARLVVAFSTRNTFNVLRGTPGERETVIFPDGRYDWKDQWRVFNGWEGYEDRRHGKVQDVR